MANITRKFVLYEITCKKLGLDEEGAPVLVPVWSGTDYDIVMNATKARRIVREETGIEKLDASYVIDYRPLREDVLAMERQAFIDAAVVVTSTER